MNKKDLIKKVKFPYIIAKDFNGEEDYDALIAGTKAGNLGDMFQIIIHNQLVLAERIEKLSKKIKKTK